MFHHIERLAARPAACVVHRDYRRVLQARADLHFSREAFLESGIGSEELLDRDVAAEGAVAYGYDSPHATARDFTAADIAARVGGR
jgi:hypothetical protein